MNDIKAQFMLFLSFVFVGMCVAILYVLTHFTKKRKIIADIVFGIAFIGGIFFANLFLNKGEFRLFVILAIFLGWYIGAKTFAPLLDSALFRLYNLLTKLIGNEADATDTDKSKQENTVRVDNRHRDIGHNGVMVDNAVRTKRRVFKKNR
jgi:hypothetical protein